MNLYILFILLFIFLFYFLSLYCYLDFYFIFYHKLSILKYFKLILFNQELYMHSNHFAIILENLRTMTMQLSFTIICKSFCIFLGAELSHKFAPVYRVFMKKKGDAGS